MACSSDSEDARLFIAEIGAYLLFVHSVQHWRRGKTLPGNFIARHRNDVVVMMWSVFVGTTPF